MDPYSRQESVDELAFDATSQNDHWKSYSFRLLHLVWRKIVNYELPTWPSI